MTIEDFVNEFGETRHGPGLSEAVAEAVSAGPLVMSWCDGHGTRLTVLFTLPTKVGLVPGLNPADRWLYVAVEGYGTYGFAVKNEPLAAGYIAEKLGCKPGNSPRVNLTWEAMADLVGGVRIALARVRA